MALLKLSIQQNLFWKCTERIIEVHTDKFKVKTVLFTDVNKISLLCNSYNKCSVNTEQFVWIYFIWRTLNDIVSRINRCWCKVAVVLHNICKYFIYKILCKNYFNHDIILSYLSKLDNEKVSMLALKLIRNW